MKSISFWVFAVGLAACNRAQPTPTETTAPPPEPGAVVPTDPSPGDGVVEAISPPAELDVDAWERVPGLTSVAQRSCAVQSDGFTRCAFTAANGFEARIRFRTFDTGAATQFECESLAGAVAGPTLQLGAGYSRWETRDTVLLATDSLCLSVQVFQNGALDHQESLRVGTELAENAASLARAEAL